MHIGVIGCGMVGLTTALELQKEFRNAQISIVADKFNEDTCSYVAAGLFRPSTSFTGPTKDITYKWIQDSYEYWDNIRRSSEASKAGVCQLSGYIFSKVNPSIVRNEFLEKVLPIYRQADERELRLCQGDWKYGSFFTTILTESKMFLPYAADKFIQQNGKIHSQNIESFSKLQGKFDIIVNCTGLGAQNLCEDQQLVPIRGQIIKVKAPWIKMAFYGENDTYIIPGFEGVILGGCRQYESYKTEICQYDKMSIQERCYNMLPSLKKSQFIRDACGLRPHKSIVRVEPEFYDTKTNGKLKIVHNYGHGGYGICTSPGTAKYSVELVKDLHSSSNLSKL
ncbi:D-aspartate oxidase [Condylostylus longicornis]|uniref:D-aspartate oxidase n=1 Tax=Condylostylus longicornis TaxID=2530218 RepID=UPI00244E4FC5|nr:D-aspartate oxidase [Condylostylus longicornis]